LKYHGSISIAGLVFTRMRKPIDQESRCGGAMDKQAVLKEKKKKTKNKEQ